LVEYALRHVCPPKREAEAMRQNYSWQRERLREKAGVAKRKMEDKTAELIGAIGCVFAQTENAEERSKILQQIGEFIQALAGEERANQVKRYAETCSCEREPAGQFS
jgi:hypothetical protein